MRESGFSFTGLMGSLIDSAVEETSESQPGLDTEGGSEETLALEPKNDPTFVANGAEAVGVACIKDEGESDVSELLGTCPTVVSTFHIRREPTGTSGAAGLAAVSIFHILNALHPEIDFFAPLSLFAGGCEGRRSSSS